MYMRAYCTGPQKSTVFDRILYVVYPRSTTFLSMHWLFSTQNICQEKLLTQSYSNQEKFVKILKVIFEDFKCMG